MSQSMPSNLTDTSYWDHGIIEIKTRPSEKPIKFVGFANKERTMYVREDPFMIIERSTVKAFTNTTKG